MIDRAFWVVALIFYGCASFLFLLQLGFQNKNSAVWGTWFAALGSAIHLGAVVVKGITLGEFPIQNAHDSLGLLAILVLTFYLLIHWKSPIPGLGFFATCLAFVFTLIALLYANPTGMRADFTGTTLEVHVAAIILSFGVLALAFCSSLAYLLQDFLLHGKRMINFSKRLPPLDTLDFLTNRLVTLGFILLSIGIFFGSVWAQRQWGKWWSWDPKVVSVLITWLIYAVYIYSRTLSGWKGRRSVLLIILGFVLIVVTFLGTNYLPGKHRFVLHLMDSRFGGNDT